MQAVQSGEQKNEPRIRVVFENDTGVEDLEPGCELPDQEQQPETGSPYRQSEKRTLIVSLQALESGFKCETAGQKNGCGEPKYTWYPDVSPVHPTFGAN